MSTFEITCQSGKSAIFDINSLTMERKIRNKKAQPLEIVIIINVRKSQQTDVVKAQTPRNFTYLSFPLTETSAGVVALVLAIQLCAPSPSSGSNGSTGGDFVGAAQPFA